nr:TonB-dependent receptor [uncultured Sphaerochaeta sp.]
MNKLILIVKIIIILVNVLFLNLIADDENKTGSIKGLVIDKDTKSPLIGANVILKGHGIGAASNNNGQYTIANVPVGSYTIEFSYIGFEPVTRTDIIVRSDRTTFVNTEMSMSLVNSDEVIVTSGFFPLSAEEVSSSANFNYEEIRRAPGSAGDVSRILMTLPGIGKVDDQKNSLIVRGGSPNENSFYIDNIEIPNINHFPTQGSSGGPISLINVDFIQDVNFYSGGFSTLYGDKLSSVMNIQFREGNSEEFDGQLDLNFTGFGGVFEGPLFGNTASWLISVRRSYIDFLIDMVDVGSTVAPTYGDVNWKIVYDINSNNKLTFLGVVGDDHLHSDRQNGIDNDMIIYAKQDLIEGTAGLNWRALWGSVGYSNTSVAFTFNDFVEDAFRTGTDELFMKNRSLEKTIKFRNVNHLKLGRYYSIDFGIDAKQILNNYDNFYGGYLDIYGTTHEATFINRDFNESKIGAFINYSQQILPGWNVNLGLRTDYFSFTKNVNISPRLSSSFELSPVTSLNVSVGSYSQNLPSLLLMQNPGLRNLKDPMAIHYIAGINHLLSEDTRLTLEFYRKEYKNFPMDPEKPEAFIIDEIYDPEGSYTIHNELIDNGEAESWGVELMLQKKLAKNFYGIVSSSYFRSQYKDYSGTRRDRIFDNKFLFNIEGGYKPNEEWEFSMRWIYAGGRPYTTFDLTASTESRTGILDLNQFNESRYPAYHSMNVRVDKRFHFESTNLIIYLSIWNAYNRKNTAMIYWNEINNEQRTIYQWSLLPILGVEYEF